MGLFFGGIGAAGTCVPTIWLLEMSTTNLDSKFQLPLLIVLSVLSAIVGFLVGGAIGRRLSRQRAGLAVFAALAAGVGYGGLGALLVAGISGSYLYSYGTWPSDLVGQALYVLAIPAFAAVGWFVGMAGGAVVGLLGGSLLRLLPIGGR